MNNTNTGGPAFPIDAYETADRCIYTGMTLRDYFAAKAMQGHCPNVSPEHAARRAYDYADAMLKARES